MPVYLEDESLPKHSHYIWAYHVKLKNLGKEAVKLLNRHWKITDSNGRVQEVKGEGVIGKQPTIKPGETFEYASGTHLPTSSGIMGGTYEMVNEKGEKFEIDIPTFSLDSPEQMKKPN